MSSRATDSRPERRTKTLLNRALVRRAPRDDMAVWAGVLTLVGCTFTIVSAFLPWAEQAVFGISIAGLGVKAGAILLAVLAAISAGLAVGVLFRRPAVVIVVIALVVLAVAELGLAIWNAVNIVQAIEQTKSHAVFIGAIGTGAYGAVIGSLATLAGGILAGSKRDEVPS
jgi:hypothetical protein